MVATATQETQTGLRPIDRFLALLKGYHTASRGYTACCPAHNDSNPSLLIWEDEKDGHVGVKCFAGCERKAVCEALGITESDLYVSNGYRPKCKPRKLDLLDLAVDKLIPPVFLVNLHIADGYTWHTPKGKTLRNVVRIPYFNMDGTEYSRARVRTAPTAKQGSFWEGEGSIIPYGLPYLETARKAGYLVLPEGESDCWTLWLHDIPALGIPGAENIKVVQAEHVAAFPPALYIIQEPDDAGNGYVAKMAARLAELGYQGKMYAVSLKTSHDAKDPNDLHKKLHTEGRVNAFKEEFQRAREAATLLDIYAAKESGAPSDKDVDALRSHVLDAIEKEDIQALYDLADQIAALDRKHYGPLTAEIQRGMKKCPGFSWSAFKKCLQDAQKEQRQRERAERARVTNKPAIVLGRQLAEEVDDALAALQQANKPPFLFVRGGALVRVRLDEKRKPAIDRIDEHSLIAHLTRVAEFVTYNEEKDAYSNAYPPPRLARTILGEPGWQFPALEGLTEVPIIRPDGSILETPGYDAETHLYYIPQPGLHIPPIPHNPTREQIEQARDFAFSFIADFPFASAGDYANACGELITVVARNLFRLVPAADIEAPKQGTGKGLYSKVVATIATGRTAPVTPMPSTEEEWEKMLTSKLLAGETFISIDNIERVLNSPKFASFLTSDVWSGRLLGTNKTPELPQHCTVLVNGNNVMLGGDIPRRCFRIRLDAGTSRPWERNVDGGFKYDPLLEHVEKRRGEIIAALLTLVRAWFVAGQPMAAIRDTSEFSQWKRTVGGILAVAGIPDFLANNDALYEEADTEGTQWANFLQTWVETLGDQELKIKDLMGEINNHEPLKDTLPDSLAAHLEKENARAFGKALDKRSGTPYGADDLRLVKGRDLHSKVATWKVAGKVAGFAGFAGFHPPDDASENFFSSHGDEKEKEKKNNVENGDCSEQTPQTPQNPASGDATKKQERATSRPDEPAHTTAPRKDNADHVAGFAPGNPANGQGDSDIPALPESVPEEARNLYSRLANNTAFRRRGNVLYQGDYLPRRSYFARLAAHLSGDDQSAYTAALAELHKRLAEVGEAVTDAA